MKAAIGTLVGVIIAVAGWVFYLQAQVGNVRVDMVGMSRDHDEFRKASALLPGMDARLKKLEGVLELIAREKEEPAVMTPISLQALDGPWKVQFGEGTSGKSVFEVLDSKTFKVTGKENKDGTLEVKGTGELKRGTLVIHYRATSKKYPKGFNGTTKLTPFSLTLLKGYFTNDLGDFDSLTLTRKEE